MNLRVLRPSPRRSRGRSPRTTLVQRGGPPLRPGRGQGGVNRISHAQNRSQRGAGPKTRAQRARAGHQAIENASTLERKPWTLRPKETSTSTQASRLQPALRPAATPPALRPAGPVTQNWHPPALRPISCSQHSGQPQPRRHSGQRVHFLRTGTLRQQVTIPGQSEWAHATSADRFRDLRHSRTRQRSSKEGCPSSARPMGRLSLRQRTAEPCLQSHSP